MFAILNPATVNGNYNLHLVRETFTQNFQQKRLIIVLLSKKKIEVETVCYSEPRAGIFGRFFLTIVSSHT
jgi:hypothetical protein